MHRGVSAMGGWCAALVVVVCLTRGAAGGCGVAQFACRSGECVRLDRYCDGSPHCADASDEPPHCTVCNRTFYGRAGLAYSLTLLPPARAPFLCHLTFTAGGGAHGDLVQLAFDEFKVGRYEPAALDGCPDGYMQLAELGRPFTGGSWCGEAAGAALYYSETATVTASVKLFRVRLGDAFAMRLRYKFLSRRDAVVRFGAADAPLERGAVAPGTYCTRTYEECHRKPCRLQSPNYPGMYPRNVTCYWSLRQKDIPTCKHAMISVRQEYSHKMQIKRSISMASLNKTGRAVRAWRECTGERDRLIVYDGPTTDDPVLVEYCGGDWLPRVTSRGPDMLVAFHSSPFSAPPPPAAPPAPLRGFELDVDVVFADFDSLDYAREARRCEFHVKASSSEEDANATAIGSRGRRGRLRAPAHTLPPNTTCTWTFHGRPGDLVWIYFSSFTHYSLVESRRMESGEEESRATAPPATCSVEVAVWDGAESSRTCDVAPFVCARAALANATRAPRPCSPPDGLISKAALLTLGVTSRGGTATHPLRFSLHYEFVDARMPGLELVGRRAKPPECARLLAAPVNFTSPRNALWYGRGGARSLRCIYRVETNNGAGLQLQLLSSALGTSPRCTSRRDPWTGLLACVPDHDSEHEQDSDMEERDSDSDDDDDYSLLTVPHIRVYESPWPGYRVPLACICDNTSMITLSGAGGLELELVSRRLSAREDHRHVRFAARATPTAAPRACAQERRIPPPGGHIELVYPYSRNHDSRCGEVPFLLEARGNRSVFLRVWGTEIPLPEPATASAPAPAAPPPESLCHTSNRILVFDDQSKLMFAICPSRNDQEGSHLHIRSSDWGGERGVRRAVGRRPALLVVWAAREAGVGRLAWMEVWRPAGTSAGEPEFNLTAGCIRACATVDACMPPDLWCDGAIDCPGGTDETASCGAGARLLAALGARGAGAAAAALALLALGLAVGAVVAVARARRHKPAAARLADSRASSVAS